ncbi:MAG: hypothetical protein KDC53_19300 [Saprospiraceae bacterium]|nr:hypothetical protein [Saprospiraceae bacterium]
MASKYIKGIVLIAASLIMILNITTAQDNKWAEEGATWHYTQIHPVSGTLIIGYTMLEAVGDTIIHDTLAQVIRHSVYQEFEPVYRSPIYIHQEGKKVYYFLKNRFTLLYDLAAEVGDTLEIVAPIYEFQDDSIMYFRVDSVEEISVVGNQLIRQNLYPIDKGATEYAVQFSGWNIEKMGNQQFFLPVYQLDCDNNCTEGLRCYEDAEISQKFVDFPCDTFDYTVSYFDLNTINLDFEIAPNPARDHISIAIGTAEVIGKTFMQLLDARGSVVTPVHMIRASKEDLYFSVSAGVYYLRVWNNECAGVKKIAVIH